MNNRRRWLFAQQARWFTDYVTDSDAKAERARIIADGGSDSNIVSLSNFFKLVKGYTGAFEAMEICTGKEFGVNKDGSNAVSKWYDVSGNDRDEVQATGSKQPIFNASGLTFDGSDDYLGVSLDFRAVVNWTITLKFTGGTKATLALCSSITTNPPYALIQLSNVSGIRFYVDNGYRYTTAKTLSTYIMTMRKDASNNYTFFINGASVGTYSGGNTNSALATSIFLGWLAAAQTTDASYVHSSAFSAALSDDAIIAIHNFFL